MVATPRVDVYYPNGHQQLGEQAARLSEMALNEVQQTFDYASGNRFQLWVYPSAASFRTAFAPLDERPTDRLHINQAKVYFPGSQEAFFRQIKAKLAFVNLSDMFFGDGTSRQLQNRASLYLPDWLFFGLSDYVGEGWQPADEMVLQSLERKRILGKLYALPADHTSRTLQKSIWYFLEQQYGRKKLQEVVYMTRLTRSMEGGLISVLGLDEDTFTQYWLDYIGRLQSIPRDRKGESVRRIKLLKPNERLVSAAMAPDQSKIAITTEQGGILRLKYYNRSRGRVERSAFKWGIANYHPANRGLSAPVAFAPNGQRLAFVRHRSNKIELVYWEPYSGQTEVVNFPSEIDAVTGLSWSPDGRQLAISAVQDGRTDLFLSSAYSASLKPLTRDMFDDLSPEWSADGKEILFQSNRDSVLSTNSKKYDWRFYGNATDLYAYNLAEKSIRRLTDSPTKSEATPFATDSGVYFLSLEYGIPTLNRKAGMIGLPVVNYLTGAMVYDLSNKGFLFTSALNGEEALYLQTELPTEILGGVEYTRASLEAERSLREEQQQRRTAQRDSIRRARQDSIQATVRDSLEQARQEEEEAIRYYIFDEEETEQEEAENENRRSRGAYRREQEIEAHRPTNNVLDINALRFRHYKPYEQTFQLEGAHLQLGNEPLYDFYADFWIEVADPLHHHTLEAGFRGYSDFRSNDTYLRYNFSKLPVHFGLNATRRIRFFEDFRIFKFRNHLFELHAAYPFGGFQRVEAGLGYHFYQRQELYFTDNYNELDGKMQALLPRVSYIWDNTRELEGYPYKGVKARADLRALRDNANGSIAFYSAQLDARYYREVFNSLIFAVRLSGGVSWGDAPQRFFLGGINQWLNDQTDNQGDFPADEAIYALENSTFAAPVRGFNINARNGKQFGLANAELRMPLRKMVLNKLNVKQLFNLNWVFFYDVGTAWDEGNPFSQRNPINVETVNRFPFEVTVQSLKSPFLQGVGTGLEAVLFGVHGRVDLAWGIEDGEVNAPILGLSLRRSF